MIHRCRCRWLVQLLIVLFCIGCLTLVSMAAALGAGDAPRPEASGLGQILIPLITPVLIAVAKLLVPRLPKKVLPILAPVLGALLEVCLHFAGAGTGGPLIGAILGSAGVGLREIVDQLRKRQQVTQAPG